MKPCLIISFITLSLIFSCKQASKNHGKEKAPQLVKMPAKDTVAKYKSLMGYRFAITGDFNGDGKQETLTEHYYSDITHKETNKFYEFLDDYDELVKRTISKQPHCFVGSSNPVIGDLEISGKSASFGLAYLKNEGDLDGDGASEVSYVVNWVDRSNVNSWQIISYKYDKWQPLYDFSIWDWQLPDVPQTYNVTGSFGRESIYVNTRDQAANKKIAQNLKNFKGLVKKVAINKIRVIYMNKEAVLDTTMVNLRTKGLAKEKK